jgi:flagellar motor switch protein FliG
MCYCTHLHLFETLKDHKQAVEINLLNEYGESALSIALNEKSPALVDKILRMFKTELKLHIPLKFREELAP